MGKVALIAGGGSLPIELLKSARRQGDKIIVFALKGSALEELDSVAEKIYWFNMGEYKKLAFLLVKEGVRQIILVGKVNKDAIYQNGYEDEEFKAGLKGLDNKKDYSILEEITKHLDRFGIKVIDGLKYLAHLLPEEGVISTIFPDDNVEKDIEFGFDIAKRLAGMDIGQTIVVKDGSVVAVEAMEGTDATIRRARKIAGRGCVMIKVSRPNQDMRWDVPTIGPDTIKVLAENEFAGLALESDKMFLLDKDEVRKIADSNKIAVKVLENRDKKKKNVLIVSGEPSGDIRGGELLAQLKPLLPEVSFWGVGGDSMAQEGAELVEHIRNFSMVGAWEVVKKLPAIHQQYKKLVQNIQERKPDFAILIDYPGFNLKIAKFLKESGISVIYYIIPQVWAWGPGRIKRLKAYVDKALVLFDFEEELLSKNGIDCKFVGHPLIDSTPMGRVKPEKDKTDEVLTIALLPGSRKHEITHMLPVMLEAAGKIKEDIKRVRFIVAESSNVDKSIYNSYLILHPDLNISSVENDVARALSGSDFAIVTSGTATLEAAIMEVPMVIVYKTALITYLLSRLVKIIPFLGLANIVAKEEVAPELLQGDFNADNLSKTVLGMIKDSARMDGTRKKLAKIKHSLGEKGAARRAAEEVYKFTEKQ